jgi:ribosomal-protein-alanine N-acetyltransferase
MDKTVTIRKAIISDSDEITNITQECFNEYGPPSSEIIAKLINNNRGYVITYESHTIGYLLCYCKNKVLNISSIGITEHYRGKGFGRKLMKQCIKDNKTCGVEVFSLHVNVNNIVAKDLYESLGFKVAKLIIEFYGSNGDAYYMILSYRDDLDIETVEHEFPDD